MVGEESDNTIDQAIESLLVKPQQQKSPVQDTPRVPEGDDVQDEPDTPPDDLPPPVVDEPPSEEEDVDIDDIEIDLHVDGEDKKVKIRDLKARYAGEGAIDSRLQRATELQQYLDQQNQAVYATFEEQKARLKRMDDILAEQSTPNIDWEALRTKDPGRYLLERERQRDIDSKRQALYQEHQRVQHQQAEMQNQARARYVERESQALVRALPDLGDEEKAPKVTGRLLKAAKHFGYTEQEFGSVLDHRAMLVLNAASQFLAQQQAKQEITKKEVTVKPLLKAGAQGSRTRSPATRIVEAQRKKAQETGKPEDVAKTLLVPMRGRR